MSGSPKLPNKEARSWRVRSKRSLGAAGTLNSDIDMASGLFARTLDEYYTQSINGDHELPTLIAAHNMSMTRTITNTMFTPLAARLRILGT